MFPVVVNYDVPLQELVAVGKYDYVDSGVLISSFTHIHPIEPGKREINIELVHYGQGMTSGSVQAEMDSRGLRSATISELLSFGSAYPEKQREFKIVALGSMTVPTGTYLKCPNYSSLEIDKYGRRVVYLSPHERQNLWNGYCRFAAVRK